jgi:hypothetical protein
VPHVSLTNFRLDHLDIEARTAGTIANAKNWTTTDNSIKTADGSKVQFTDTPMTLAKKTFPAANQNNPPADSMGA